MKKKVLNKDRIKLFNFIKALHSNLNFNSNSKELFILDGVVKEKSNLNNFFEVDCSDCIISPGFIDPQINGYKGWSFWSSENLTWEDLNDLCTELAFCGVTGFCPTIITNKKEKILKSIDHLNLLLKKNKFIGAQILGFHIEGIFISKYGVHSKSFVEKNLTKKNIKPFIKENVILFTLAPELDKTGGAIKLLKQNKILVSAGHTNGTYEDGLKAINDYGINCATHMFNAMHGVEGFSHRGNSNPEVILSKLKNKKNISKSDGIMLALLESKKVLTMLIADGIHVNKQAVKLLSDLKGDNFSLTSDLVDTDFFKSEEKKGILGGGQETIDKCVRNLIKWKIKSPESALLLAREPILKKLNLPSRNVPRNFAQITIWNTKKNNVKGTIIGKNVFLNY